MIRRIFNLSVSGLTILWSIGMYAIVPTAVHAAVCPTLAAGDLFKVSDSSAVYLVNSNMERMYFPHGSVYQTWYSDYSGVKEIPNTCVDNYPAPAQPPYGVNYRPGSKLVKVQISPSVYVVEPGNKISKMGSETVAKSLYGENWASKVVDVADVFWPNYITKGTELTEAIPHDGMLVRVSGSDIVYQVENNKRYVVDGTVRGDVQVVTSEILNSVTEADTSVISEHVYDNPSQLEVKEVTAPGEGTTTETPTTTLGVANKRITTAVGGSIKPSIVWNGLNYGLVWSDVRNGDKGEIFFALLDEEGNKIGNDVQITNTPTLISTNPEIIWNGTNFAVVYAEYDDVLSVNSTVNFLRISSAGAKIGNVTEVVNVIDKTNPSMAYDGSGYGIIWRTPNNSNAKTYFSYLNANGEIVKNQVRVLTDEASDNTEIVWDGSMFGIVYRQSIKKIGYGDTVDYTVGTYLYRVDQGGDAVKSKLFITGKEALAAVWDGQKYVVVEDNKTFSRFDANANLLITNKQISADGLSNSDIINDGTQYGIVGERGGLVYFVEADSTGAVKQSEMKINDTANTVSTLPRITWSGNKYAIVWSDAKDENSGGEIYFRAVNKSL